ncbi:MAG: TIGR03936 family radical SAM-associated protein [Acidimicrobiales bacterium]
MIVRLRFRKFGKIRFIGHRDVARIFERSLRAAGIPVAYSEGFSPRPKLAFGLALSVGYESDNEYIDVVLSERLELDDVVVRLAAALPAGLDLIEVGEAERSRTSLMESVTSCDWDITLSTADIDTVRASVDALLAADRVIINRERKGKPVQDDIRPDLLSVKVLMNPETATCRIHAELGTESRSLRPAEFLAAIDPPVDATRIRRAHQWISHGTTRTEPHEAVVERAAHPERVAS